MEGFFAAKGQEISKANYLVLNSSKKTNEIFAKFWPGLLGQKFSVRFFGRFENKIFCF